MTKNMDYFRIFNDQNEYNSFKESENFIKPHVAYITETNMMKYDRYVIPASTGDITYFRNNKIKTISKDEWNSSLGTPIGVVVIPEGFLPDGRARMVSLNPVDANGNSCTSPVWMMWGPTDTDTSLTNFDQVPLIDNKASTTTRPNTWGWLPSDKFTDVQSFVDPFAKYAYSTTFIPSPYLGDNKTFNPAYSEVLSGYNNALSDFNGLTNTETLVGLGSDYIAANAAWNYNDGVSSTQWYLPAMGELGFLMPRFNVINELITAVGGIAVAGGASYWGSSECDSNDVYSLSTYSGKVEKRTKNNSGYVRPFGVL